MTRSAPGQEHPPAADTSKGLPQLEIPEITIVGKKPITLPFARKGEIYDVRLYEAPGPDTSLLDSQPPVLFPAGSLPRYEIPLVPLHISAEGFWGSFNTLSARAFVDYIGRKWGIYGNGGIGVTQGHTDHASGRSFEAEINARSIVATDNEVLRTFRMHLGTTFMHDTYGMFGIRGAVVDRSRDNITLDTRLSSVDHRTNDITLSLRANVLSMTDSRRLAGDSSVSGVSPELAASYATDIGRVRFLSGMSYKSSSLAYSMPVQSASLAGIYAGAEGELARDWFLSLGGNYEGGSGSDGMSHALIAPFCTVRWSVDADREVRFYFRPEMRLALYDEDLRANPYLIREAEVRPERVPVNIGAGLWYNSELFSLELNASFTKSSDRPVVLADSAGGIRLGYLDAQEYLIEAAGTVRPSGNLLIRFSGDFRTAFEEGSSIQLPMVPVVELTAKAEYALSPPLRLWVSADYAGRQNADRAGAVTLTDRLLLGAGVSSTVVPRTILSLSAQNIFNAAYEWWRSYTAPGRALYLSAKVNVR